MKEDPFDCIVIGGGPAGLTAAIYLKRFGRKILVIDSDHSRLKRAPKLMNYTGFERGIQERA
jgi:thioredoxin reductase (NADPH)